VSALVAESIHHSIIFITRNAAMVDELLSDEEREEALLEWWRENWRWIISGIVLGMALLVGWHYWTGYRQHQAEAAGALYGQVEAAANANDAATAQKLLDQLAADHDKSPYAQQARLLVARLDVEAGRMAEAESLLRDVMNKSQDKELADIATLRVARLMIQQGRHDDAVKLLEPLTEGGFGAQAREIRGDALLGKGDREGARAEYAAALASVDAQIDRQMVELKLQDVGGVAPAAAAK
jgi:predicted negative regulator of RcsB-dependent stress response